MERRRLRLINEPRGDLYRRILDLASQDATTAYAVLRPTVPLDATAVAALGRLKEHEIGRREVGEWPGTRLLFGATATLVEFRMTAELSSVLASLASGLYEWMQPRLPEDLGFLRDDGSTWLASISHERDGYFEMSMTEERSLLSRVPELSGLLASDV